MIAAAALAASLWAPDDLAKAQKAIDVALSAPTLRGAHAGVLAVDAVDGTPLYQHNARDAFIPASTFKLLVGSAALAKLGPAFAFVTEVNAAGTSLALKGGGDPLLDAQDMDLAASAVATAGTKRYDSLIADASRYNAPRYPDGWSIDDIPYDYSAIPSALSLEENVLHAGVRPGGVPGDSTTLITLPVTDAITIENDVVTGAPGSEDTTDITRPWDRPTVIQLIGSYPLGEKQLSDDFRPAVPDPPAYAVDVLRLDLIQHGVETGTVTQAKSPSGAIMLWRHESMPLSKMLAKFWQPSDNFIGEQLLLELGASSPNASRDKLGTRYSAIEVESAYLRSIGIDPKTVTIADGSGLSEYDRISPAALAAILRADWNGPNRQTFLDALPLAGVRGTLESSFTGTPLAGNVYAKTGTINHTRTLAGYLMTKRHGTIIFAILINDWMDASPHASAAIEKSREAILEALQQ